MRFKAIVCDLDGTLLNQEHTISKNTIETIKKITDLGIKFFIATGRHHLDALKFKNMLGLNSYLISSNGARIHDENNNIIFKNDISKELAREIFNTDIPSEIHKDIYLEDKWYLETPLVEAKEYHKESGFSYTVTDFSKLYDKEIIKFFYIHEDENKIKELEKKLIQKFGDRTNITLSLPICLEIMNKNVSKGHAITDVLMPRFGLKKEEIIGFGDGLNDYEMLKSVGEGILMGNCNPRLKALLPDCKIAKKNSEDGVAEYLKEIFL